MEIMKFDEARPAEGGTSQGEENKINHNNNIGNNTAPKAPGASGAVNEMTNEANTASGASVPVPALTSVEAEETLNHGENNENKGKKKLIIAGGVLAILILAVVGWQYWQYTQTAYYKQMQMVKAIDASIKESDKWGGKTPEETVRLFTEAVKKGDFELAGKYGTPALITPELEKMKADGKMDLLLRELESGIIKEFIGGGDANLMADIDGLKVRVLSMNKSKGGTWKIDEF